MRQQEKQRLLDISRKRDIDIRRGDKYFDKLLCTDSSEDLLCSDSFVHRLSTKNEYPETAHNQSPEA